MGTQRLRLVCIDDEARILRSLRALFREHEVYITTDPDEAVRLACEKDADVVISDQRMPLRPGIEVLREVKEKAPRAMRILLTGYSDLQAVIDSVNEGEVFRFVTKPWNNTELRAIVTVAGGIARAAPPVSDCEEEAERDKAREEVGILAIEDDPAVKKRLRQILSDDYHIRFAPNPDIALQIMEEHEIGVLISETQSTAGDLTGLLKALARHHPHIATLVITERANANNVIDLINEGQVYRLLLKPVRQGSCKLSVDSAIGRYWNLKQNPAAAKRFYVKPPDESTEGLGERLLRRIRLLPSRLRRPQHAHSHTVH